MSSPSAATSRAIAVSSAVYVLVAAIARSGPAPRSRTCSAVVASAEPGSLVIAIVGRPWRRAASTTPTTSGDAPDWLIPMTSDRENTGSTWYSDTIDGAASATGSRIRIPNRYWA